MALDGSHYRSNRVAVNHASIGGHIGVPVCYDRGIETPAMVPAGADPPEVPRKRC